MNQQRAILRLVCKLVLLYSLAACGGGDGTDTGAGKGTTADTGGSAGTGTTGATGGSAGVGTCAGTAAAGNGAPNVVTGVYGGTLKDDVTFDLLYAVMADGTKVGFFGTDWSNAFKFVGTWVSTDSVSSWTSLDGTISRSFNGAFRGDLAYVAATVDTTRMPCLSGLITVGQFTTRTVTFDGGRIPGSSYVLDSPASVAAVAGPWELADSAARPMKIDIAANGSLKGIYRDCNFTGSVKPSDGGENALMLSFDFDEPVSNCQPDLENSTGYRGFAIALPLTTGRTRLVVFVGSNAGWDWITLQAVGQR